MEEVSLRKSWKACESSGCVCGGGGDELSKQRASVRLGPVWCGHRAEGPGDGAESVRQEVRSERCPGTLVQQCEGVAFISYERGASVTAEVCPRLYLNCGRETG